MTLPNETRLWQAVIERAIKDALGYGGCKIEEKHDAMRWIVLDLDHSFSAICDLADVEPDCIRKKLLRKLNNRAVKPRHSR